MAITTNRKFNFTHAENETFVWDDSWSTIFHKPSGRSIYQMHWLANGKQSEAVEPEIRAELNAFYAELETLKNASKQVSQISGDDVVAMMEEKQLMAKMDREDSDL